LEEQKQNLDKQRSDNKKLKQSVFGPSSVI
jgi:hypothetical protein